MYTTLTILGVIVGIFILYLLAVALIPGMAVPEQGIIRQDSQRPAALKTVSAKKEVGFQVKGTDLSAWLFLPNPRSTPVPCIVMAHGLGGTKDCGLDKYAARFQDAGFAVLAFDYRFFGQSRGEPRQLVWIPYQLEDWAGAIAYARSLEEVDDSRIALWGSSLSGGHVIVMAAKDHNIACAVAQCPGLDGRASAKWALEHQGLAYTLRQVVHGQRDLVRSWLKLSPHKVPLVGKPGTVALMSTPDAYESFGRIAPKDFINQACARIIIRGDKYRPLAHAKNVRCPILLQICDHDDVTPPSAVQQTINELGQYAEVKHYPIGHFDVYLDANFEQSIADQVDFFKKHIA
jgi:cephalosporin-C deacetylase-like acetyl esterase